MPLGIPNKKISTEPRATKFEIWEGVIQQHFAEKAGDHYDLRIGDPQTGKAHSWVVKSIPEPGQKVLAIKQPDHSLPYMDFAGTIKKGYGKGRVKKVFRDKIELIKSEPGKISFNLYRGKASVRLHLIKTNFGWILFNTTLTTKSRPDIPLFKPSYKSIDIKNVKLTNDREVFAPKVDGAHNIISLRKDKPIEVTSYRPSKTKAGLIDHSFKTGFYKIIPPPELNDTMIRAELFGVTKEGKVLKSTETAGLLNSEVWKARASGNKMGNIIFDIIKYKGKDVSDRPYKEKLLMLKEISDKIPGLNLPPMAHSTSAKTRMLAAIQLGKSPVTKEGLVIYDLDKSVPIRSKLQKDIDVYVKSTFLGKGRLAKKMVGGFEASRTLEGKPLIRVGSGLSDKLRKDMYKYPQKYIGRTAKIYVQEEYPSGKARVPILKEFREMF